MRGVARAGLLVASLLVLVGVVQPAGSGVGAPARVSAVSGSMSGAPSWQDALHTLEDQPRRLVASRLAPTTADTWWVVYEPASGGCSPYGRSDAGAAGVSCRGAVAPPPRSSRAPPAGVS